jgi:hypothetical protein
MTIGLRRNAYIWGSLIRPTANSGPGTMTSSTIWTAAGFFLDRARTLNKVRLQISASGSPIAADLKAELYDSTGTNGSPGSSLGTFGTASATSGFVEWGGLSVALTAHTQYWIVLKNLNGTPGTNFFQYSAPADDTYQEITTGWRTWGFAGRRSTNSGSTWGAQGISMTGIRLEFADGYFEGIPITGINSNATVYSSREAGALFVSPAVDLNVRGVSISLHRGGTPTGQLRYRIYLGAGASPALLATTQLLPTATVAETTTTSSTTPHWVPLFFSSVVTIPANSTVRVVASETTQSDASGNNFTVRSLDVDNDANSKALLGNIFRTLSTDGGSTFTDTDTETVPFALILDSEVSGTGTTPELSAPRGRLPLHRYRRGHLT